MMLSDIQPTRYLEYYTAMAGIERCAAIALTPLATTLFLAFMVQ
jgi:hypothetical protein